MPTPRSFVRCIFALVLLVAAGALPLDPPEASALPAGGRRPAATSVPPVMTSSIADQDTTIRWGAGILPDQSPLWVGTPFFTNHALLHFGTSTIVGPAETEEDRVASVRLHLWLEQGTCSSDPAKAIKVLPALDAWSEATAQWPGPTVGAAVTATQTCSAESPNHLVLESTDLDGPTSLAALVQSWVDETATNHGLRLDAAHAGAEEFKHLTSSEGAVVERRPVLEVTWAPTNLRVDGDDANGSAPGTPSLTYSDHGGNCYPELSTANAECKVDLYWKTPPTAASETIVLVHPGGWLAQVNGNGDGRRRGVEIERWAGALAERGYVVAVIDYRQGLYPFVAQHSPWQGFGGLERFALMYHCTQRFEVDGIAPFEWPPAATLPEQAPKPAECDVLVDDYDDLQAVGDQPRQVALADVQEAVEWIRRGAGAKLPTTVSSEVYLLGQSAGAITAIDVLLDADAVDEMKRVDGAVAMGAGIVGDLTRIDDAGFSDRGLRDPEDVAPLQVQDWEYDGVVPIGGDPDERYTAGSWDFGRETAGFLRDHGGRVELRSRCGFGHVPFTTSPGQFDHAIGDALSFFASLRTPEGLAKNVWFGAAHASGDFQKRVGQDLMEDQAVAYQPRVADFNGDDVDDILWWSEGGGCNQVWFGQGDLTFARADMSYPVAGDVENARLLGTATGVYASDNYEEQDEAVEAVVGDFDGDLSADIFWDGGATAHSWVWYGGGDPYDKDVATTGTFTRVDVGDAGAHDGVAVGDLDGDSIDDLFFSGADTIWYGRASGAPFDELEVTGVIDTPGQLVVGDYDGDGRDDVLIAPPYSTPTPPAGQIVYGDAARSTTAIVRSTAPVPPHATVVAGQFISPATEGPRADLFWDSVSATDAVWRGAERPPALGPGLPFVASPITTGPNGAYEPSVGDFDGDGFSDIYFRGANPAAGQWERYFRGGVAGFSNEIQFEQVGSDRTGIVGRFGTFEASGTVGRDDILWHVSRQGTLAKRYAAGPSTSPGGPLWWWR